MSGPRPPGQVMRLERLGASHQTRLSFMRHLLRRMRREGWRVERTLWQVDGRGVGRAVYRATGPGGPVSLVAFAHDLPDDQRTDRVIAEAWDATFALFDGEPGPEDLVRLAANVPLQEAGRVTDRELVLSRANRSGRLWGHVVERLAAGRQPDGDEVAAVGYLMRTTAVYGSGKFGAADHGALAGRGLLDGPFRAEMLAVWLIRAFSLDLVEHLARARGGAGAARLEPGMRRRFGIGNSTGLGMAPFLVGHPALLHAWIAARETALARVRARPSVTSGEAAAFATAVARAQALVAGWRTGCPVQAPRVAALAADLERLAARRVEGPAPWDALYRWAEGALTLEGQEMCIALMLEPFGALVDDLADTLGADEAAAFPVDGSWTLERLRGALATHYGWALSAPEAGRGARFWYTSEAKLEPRLGEVAEDAGAELAQPLDIAARARALAGALVEAGEGTVADLLAAHPEHRRIVRRVQLTETRPYAEIRDDLTHAGLRPVDMLRAKLAVFGATRFDPRSDRWVRITMFQHAPLPDELAALPEDDWAYPPAPAAPPIAAE